MRWLIDYVDKSTDEADYGYSIDLPFGEHPTTSNINFAYKILDYRPEENQPSFVQVTYGCSDDDVPQYDAYYDANVQLQSYILFEKGNSKVDHVIHSVEEQFNIESTYLQVDNAMLSFSLSCPNKWTLINKVEALLRLLSKEFSELTVMAPLNSSLDDWSNDFLKAWSNSETSQALREFLLSYGIEDISQETQRDFESILEPEDKAQFRELIREALKPQEPLPDPKPQRRKYEVRYVTEYNEFKVIYTHAYTPEQAAGFVQSRKRKGAPPVKTVLSVKRIKDN